MEKVPTPSINPENSPGLPEKIILCLGGSFNPPHLSHLAAMEAARAALEQRGVQVVAGYFATATDGYLRQKMAKTGAAAMRSQHRLELANQLAARTTWMRPVTKVYGSAKQLAITLIPQLGLDNCAAGIVVGADRAVLKSGKAKWARPGTKTNSHNNLRIISICIARGDDTDRVRAAMRRDRLTEADAIAKAGFLLVPVEVAPVSSTALRQRIVSLRQLSPHSAEFEALIKRTEEDKFLPRELLEYILQLSEKDLYWEPLDKKLLTKQSDKDSDDE